MFKMPGSSAAAEATKQSSDLTKRQIKIADDEEAFRVKNRTKYENMLGSSETFNLLTQSTPAAESFKLARPLLGDYSGRVAKTPTLQLPDTTKMSDIDSKVFDPVTTPEEAGKQTSDAWNALSYINLGAAGAERKAAMRETLGKRGLLGKSSYSDSMELGLGVATGIEGARLRAEGVGKRLTAENTQTQLRASLALDKQTAALQTRQDELARLLASNQISEDQYNIEKDRLETEYQYTKDAAAVANSITVTEAATQAALRGEKTSKYLSMMGLFSDAANPNRTAGLYGQAEGAAVNTMNAANQAVANNAAFWGSLMEGFGTLYGYGAFGGLGKSGGSSVTPQVEYPINEYQPLAAAKRLG
jgi:hypothetical protein